MNNTGYWLVSNENFQDIDNLDDWKKAEVKYKKNKMNFTTDQENSGQGFSEMNILKEIRAVLCFNLNFFQKFYHKLGN